VPGYEMKLRRLCTEIQGTYDYTNNNWSHQNSNNMFKEKYGSHIRKIKTDSPQKWLY
jgi:hypothetical protein